MARNHEIKMGSIYTNKVWPLVSPPDSGVPISYKWNSNQCLNAGDKVETYEVRLIR